MKVHRNVFNVCVFMDVEPDADQQERTQRSGGGLDHAGVRRLCGHEGVLAGILEFGFW